MFALVFSGVLTVLGTAQAQIKDPNGFPSRGFIINGIDEKCWYAQEYFGHKPHFLTEKLTDLDGQELRVITFENPNCMREELEGLGPEVSRMLNERMINTHISTWYLGTCVIKNAKFDIDTLRLPGKYEIRGKCIQSRTYPSKGIAVDYLTRNGSITQVYHTMALLSKNRRIPRDKVRKMATIGDFGRV